MELHTLGQRIKFARINVAKLSQGELAERAGIAQSLVSALEREQRKSTTHMVEIADALGVSIRWLVSGGGPMILPEDLSDFPRLKTAVVKFGLTAEEVEHVQEEAIKIAQEIFFNK
ncbi:helix-turn-helix domain-containing protein [Vibrio harveyi]|uniref:helix-turn-helix domain-containing protein n=1 Tax=Vibrio harveyi TaxID=669 RepID=UPI00068250C6|nr:helix-turn-helix transcriptional regulator [Vibrio harveyi]